MLIRIRHDVRGSFNNIPAAGGDCVSVRRGQTVDVAEIFGLRLVMTGRATASGGDLGKDGELPPPKELAKIRERIRELTSPDIRDVLRDRSKLNPVEREELTRRALNM
jgi:hypothetical protein